MGANTNIEWCDHTWNPWNGCTKVSQGCAHCYAEARNRRFSGGANWGKGAPRMRTGADYWTLPRRWNRQAEKATVDSIGRQPGAVNYKASIRPKVFCASLADWLDDEVPIEWFVDLLQIISSTPSLDWLLLTKRPENFNLRIEHAFSLVPWLTMVEKWNDGVPPHNVWVGASVENQDAADRRIPALAAIPAILTFLSCEPLLGPITRLEPDHIEPVIDWVICGGESGPHARPMDVGWAIDLSMECAYLGIPFFMKQGSADWPHPKDFSQFPLPLQVREFPIL